MKYLLYTNYTYTYLDLDQDVPLEEIQIIQNHPGKSVKDRSLQAQSWFDNLKLTQSKYLKDVNEKVQIEEEPGQKPQNLTISNKMKGILTMDYD